MQLPRPRATARVSSAVPTYGRPRIAIPRLSAVVKNLLIVLLVCYVTELLLQRAAGISLSRLLALAPGEPGAWQLITYVFVDLNNPIFFLVDLLFVWWALSPFEIAYGPTRTLQLCLAAVLGAGIPAWLFGFVIPSSPTLYGSSVLFYAGLAAQTWPQRDQQTSFFGLISMSGRQFLWLLVGICVLQFLYTPNHTQLIADLSAIAGGIGFIRWIKRPRTPKVARKIGPEAAHVQSDSGRRQRRRSAEVAEREGGIGTPMPPRA